MGFKPASCSLCLKEPSTSKLLKQTAFRKDVLNSEPQTNRKNEIYQQSCLKKGTLCYITPRWRKPGESSGEETEGLFPMGSCQQDKALIPIRTCCRDGHVLPPCRRSGDQHTHGTSEHLKFHSWGQGLKSYFYVNLFKILIAVSGLCKPSQTVQDRGHNSIKRQRITPMSWISIHSLIQ